MTLPSEPDVSGHDSTLIDATLQAQVEQSLGDRRVRDEHGVGLLYGTKTTTIIGCACRPSRCRNRSPAEAGALKQLQHDRVHRAEDARLLHGQWPSSTSDPVIPQSDTAPGHRESPLPALPLAWEYSPDGSGRVPVFDKNGRKR